MLSVSGDPCRGSRTEFCKFLALKPIGATSEWPAHSTCVILGRIESPLAISEARSADGGVLTITRLKVGTISASERISPPTKEAHRVATHLTSRDAQSTAGLPPLGTWEGEGFVWELEDSGS